MDDLVPPRPVTTLDIFLLDFFFLESVWGAAQRVQTAQRAQAAQALAAKFSRPFFLESVRGVRPGMGHIFFDPEGSNSPESISSPDDRGPKQPRPGPFSGKKVEIISLHANVKYLPLTTSIFSLIRGV